MKQKIKPKTLITAALPYANAPLHLGHLIEYIQGDIYTRFLKLLGQDVLYICASDMHGTPIEVKAQQSGLSPKEFAQKYHQLNKETFPKYFIAFDNYYHTDSKENQELVHYFFDTLNKKGYIHKKPLETVFCPHCQRNLPDRYVKGTCPNCGAYDQYGDVCENCSLTLKGTDLLNPRCAICNASPVKKQSEHYFFKLSKFSNKLKTWLNKTPLQPEIRNSIQEWLNKGLEDWCISRDSPYYGFKIPGEKNKYFYVWLDAPIGYIASTKNYCLKHKLKWEDYWNRETRRVSGARGEPSLQKGKIIHLVGKDIIYFHFLFWPALLMAVGFSLPKDIVVHGFLTVNGQKMSKSRGTFFTAEDFLKLYPPEYLRFYYAHHLSKKLSDLDLDFEDFRETINNTLVANLANFCYRTLSFAYQNYRGELTQPKKEKELILEIKKLIVNIQKNYQEFNFKEAVNHILKISELGNAYFQKAEPWKDPKNSLPQVSFCANLVRNLSILIQPILPNFSHQLQKQLNQPNLAWQDLNFNFTGKINKPKILLKKIEKLPSAAFFPLNLKVGQILKVEDHPQADTLYILQVDFKTEKRQAVAGLKKHFDKKSLLNKKAVFCLNIKPAKLRGFESNCMILAADDSQNIALLEAESSQPGDEVTLEGYQNNRELISFEEFKKLRMEVRNNKVFSQAKHLKTNKEDILVRGVKDGAIIE